MLKTLVGKIVVILGFVFLFGQHLIYRNWEAILVIVSAIILVPIGLELIFEKEKYRRFENLILLSAFLLLPAYSLPELEFSKILCLPYLLVTIWLSVDYVFLFFKNEKYKSLENWLPIFALGYLTVGAGWIFLFLFNIRPFDFSPTIVGLTAAHFHLAGFVLTVHVWKLIQQKTIRRKAFLSIAPLLGMPIVAAGITLSKLGFDYKIEMFGSLFFVGFVLVMIWEQIRFALTQKGLRKTLFLISAGSLLFTMILASFYAIRVVFPHEFFTIRNMKIWHGTINVLGFGLAALLGWKYMFSK